MTFHLKNKSTIQFNRKKTEPFTVDTGSREDAAESMAGKQGDAEKDDGIEK
jgi:hypothetical protein